MGAAGTTVLPPIVLKNSCVPDFGPADGYAACALAGDAGDGSYVTVL